MRSFLRRQTHQPLRIERVVASQLNFVTRRVFLEGGFVILIGKEIVESATREDDLQFALYLFALHQQHRSKLFERVHWFYTLSDGACRQPQRSKQHERE